MKLPLPIFILALLAAGGPLFAGDETAAEVPLTRYQAMIDKSPFALATAPPTPAPEKAEASFAQAFYIAGMAQLPAGDLVTIFSKDAQQSFSLQVGESFSGITLTSVAWSAEVGKSKATLKKGNEFGEIGFDEAALHASAPPVNARPRQTAPPTAAWHVNPRVLPRHLPTPRQLHRPLPNTFRRPDIRQPAHIQSRVRSRVIPNAPR